MKDAYKGLMRMKHETLSMCLFYTQNYLYPLVKILGQVYRLPFQLVLNIQAIFTRR